MAPGDEDEDGWARSTARERRLAAREQERRETREALLLDMELDALARVTWRATQIPREWDGVEAAHPTTPKRSKVTLLLDADLLAWFRAQGQGYQARINAVLRAYRAMKAAALAEDRATARRR